MEKKTNLNQVKEIANSLLMCDYGLTRFSPAIIDHPFTNSGIVTISNNKNELEMLDITSDKNALRTWQNMIAKNINKSSDFCQIYNLINKPYRLLFVKLVAEYLSIEDLSIYLADAWISSESPNQDPNVSKQEVVYLFKKADPNYLMTKHEINRYNKLENEVLIYRGVTTYNQQNIQALSWTLDCERAEWFAQRYGENGKVYQAKINKKHILSYINRRNEREVVVDPKYLKNIILLNESELENE